MTEIASAHPLENPAEARHLVLAQHGILTSRANVTWPERFEAYQADRDAGLHVVTDHYDAGPWPRINMLRKNRKLGRAQAEVLAHWIRTGTRKTEISVVGHSNGCSVVRQTVLELARRGIYVRNIILLAAPLKNDLGDIGLRGLAEQGMTRRIANWCSPNDQVLARPGDRIGAVLRWPYGNLGRAGAQDVKPAAAKWAPVPAAPLYNRWFDFGHTDYFAPENIRATFDTIIDEILTP